MKLSNIRENFSEMDDGGKRDFFLRYYSKRANDFSTAELKTIRVKKPSTSSPKEKTLKVTDSQLALLKLLNLV